MTLQSVNVIELPWQCSEHSNAKVLHSWDNTYTVGWNDGYPRGGHSSNHEYTCHECGKELRAPK